MSKDLVSIIMPIYNCEEYVEQAIETVKQQKYKNWELIIVNDGSTDNSLEKIQKSIENIKAKTQLINLKENQGVSHARNVALDRAKGTYIAYLDADDMWKENKLNRQLEFMQKKEKKLLRRILNLKRISEQAHIMIEAKKLFFYGNA